MSPRGRPPHLEAMLPGRPIGRQTALEALRQEAPAVAQALRVLLSHLVGAGRTASLPRSPCREPPGEGEKTSALPPLLALSDALGTRLEKHTDLLHINLSINSL